MARYFIHVCNGTGLIRDEEGQEFADPEAAVEAALDSVRSIVSEEARRGLIELTGRVTVEDQSGRPVAEHSFRDAFRIRLPENSR